MTGITGDLRLEERGGLGFPWADLCHGGERLATLGRYGALNIFFGRGQRIRFTDDRTWRLKGRGWFRYVCPVLVDGSGRRLADSAPGVGGDYAITCRDRAFSLIPADDRTGRARRWQLLAFDEPIADIRRNPYRASVYEPVPLQAILLAWGLSAVGVMGEKELVQQMGWTGPQAH